MNRCFYLRLAFSNLHKNRRIYIPYLLAGVLSVVIFYIVHSLAINEGFVNMFGGSVMSFILFLGCFVIALFSIIFLFYINTFLIRQRKKEFGLFNILGLEKRHLGRVIAYETLIAALLDLIGGLLLGAGIEWLFFRCLGGIGNGSMPLVFTLSMDTVRISVLLFGGIHLLLFLNSLRQIHLANPIELLHGSNVGEKEPRARWVMAAAGLLLLVIAYFMAVTSDMMSAFLLFFVAVILVIIATYLLFTAGSIALLKLLRKNKRYYYRTRPFINVSMMIYRMKQNAVGLANICILSTMVLVMLSTTISLWMGIGDTTKGQYPREYIVSAEYDLPAEEDTSAAFARVRQSIEDTAAKQGVSLQRVQEYQSLTYTGYLEQDTFSIDQSRLSKEKNMDAISLLQIISLTDYNRIMGTAETLKPNEMLVYGKKTYDNAAMTIFQQTFQVKGQLKQMVDLPTLSGVNAYYVVVADETVLRQIEQEGLAVSSRNSRISRHLDFDVDSIENGNATLSEAFTQGLSEQGLSYYVNAREDARSAFVALYGGLLFIGISLSVLFIMATILILYYKQISEGYEDKERFIIMQKVGMDRHEVKGVIRSQVLTVFFLPLVMAGIHITFAFPMIRQMMQALSLMNAGLFIWCTLICFGVFAIVYALIYLLTSKVYYGIVRRT